MLPDCVCAALILRLKSEDCAAELVEQLCNSAFSSSHELFLVVGALMFISPGMSSPALSHRFHTFLLANLTVLLPAAEREPGVEKNLGNSVTAAATVAVLHRRLPAGRLCSIS